MNDSVLVPACTHPVSGNLLDFLHWLAARPRSYAEVMDAWRTSCPRLSVWEDAIDGDFACLDSNGAACQAEVAVRLTPRGMALLDDYRREQS